MYSDRVRPAPIVEPLRVLPVVLIALFVVVAAVDLLLASQPPLIATLRDAWQHALSVSSVPTSWGSLLAAGISVAAVALSAAVLTAFIRGAHAAPYATLAPVLVGCCTLVLGRMPVSLPVPVSPPVFAGLATLMLIGGGNLFRASGFVMNSVGALLATTPLALLWAGYFGVHGSAAAALHPFDRNAQVFTFVLGFASLGAPLLAIACRRPRRANWGDNADELGGQIVELLERAESAEARANAAERQLGRTGRLRLTSDDDSLAMMRPASGPWMRMASWLCFAAFLAGAYFAGYVPLQKRLTTQIHLNKTQVDQHAAAMTAMRTRFEDERHELEQQLAAAQSGKPASGAVTKGGAPAAAQGSHSVAAPNVAGKAESAAATGASAPKSATAAQPGAAAAAKPSSADGSNAKAAPAPADTKKAKPAAPANDNAGPQSKAEPSKTDPTDVKAAPAAAAHAAHAAAKPAEKRHAAPKSSDQPEPAAAGKAPTGVSKANDPLAGLDGM